MKQRQNEKTKEKKANEKMHTQQSIVHLFMAMREASKLGSLYFSYMNVSMKN